MFHRMMLVSMVVDSLRVVASSLDDADFTEVWSKRKPVQLLKVQPQQPRMFIKGTKDVLKSYKRAFIMRLKYFMYFL